MEGFPEQLKTISVTVWNAYKDLWKKICKFIRNNLQLNKGECEDEDAPIVFAVVLFIVLCSLLFYMCYECRRNRALRRRREQEPIIYNIDYEQFMMGPGREMMLAQGYQ